MKLIRLLLFLSFLICFIGSAHAAEQNVADHEEFENGVSHFWYLASAGNSYNGQVSTNYADSGTHSYRLELRSTDRNAEGSKRSELESHPEPALQEGIYNFSEYFVNGGSEDWAVDNANCGEVVAQWHQNPDSGDTLDCGPSLSLNVFPANDGTSHWYLSSLSDDRASTNSYTGWDANTHFIEYDLGPIIKGQWVKWSFHIKWGWQASQNPFLKVYRNGVIVVDNTRPNTFNDKQGVNQQIGIYKPGWNENGNSKLTSRVIYVDDISTSYVTGDTPVPDPVPTPTPTPEPTPIPTPTPIQTSYKPIANFTCNVTSGKVPLTVKFTDKSTNATVYRWNFGDGTTTKDINPVHTFSRAGTYTVSLKAVNAYGTSLKTVKITVTPKYKRGYR